MDLTMSQRSELRARVTKVAFTRSPRCEPITCGFCDLTESYVGVLGVGVVIPVVGIEMEDCEMKKKTTNAYPTLATDIHKYERKTYHDGKD